MKLDTPPDRLRPIGAPQLDRARQLATASPRNRAILRYHEHHELLQRMLNALSPGTYVPPHRHADPDKVEVFLALEGSAAVCRFDDGGALVQATRIAAAGPTRGVEIPPRTWHTVICLEPGTVLYELIEGPYSVHTHKRQAPWAPDEGSAQATDWLAALETRVQAMLQG